MAATVTLSSTVLQTGVGPSDSFVNLLSVANVAPGLFLWIDQEFMKVTSIGLPSNGGTNVNVLRGRGGKGSSRHSSSATVYIGRGDQFYSADPSGAPPAIVLVTPHINTTNGNVWLPQGDDQPSLAGGGTNSYRWWQLLQNIPGYGSLGIRNSTPNPPSSN